MKAYLLDTNIASALWDGGDKDHAEALKFVQGAAAAGDRIYVSRVTFAEVEYGVKLYASADPTRRADKAMQAFTAIREIDKGTTDPYSSVRAALFTKYAPKDAKSRVKNARPERLLDKTTGQLLGIQENDLWIAAIAIEYKMVLVTEDKMVRIQEVAPSLTVVRWRQPSPPPMIPAPGPTTPPK